MIIAEERKETAMNTISFIGAISPILFFAGCVIGYAFSCKMNGVRYGK